jgi:ribonuclease HI
MEKGWAKKWKQGGWMRSKKEKAENVDLWSRLLELCDWHQVQFLWVKGHAHDPENNRCDALAGEAARGKHLPADENYEKGATTVAESGSIRDFVVSRAQ